MSTPDNETIYTIQCMDKSIHKLPFSNDSTVGDMRIEASKIKNCEPTLCKLIHMGTILGVDEKKLSELNIKPEQKIILLIQQKAKIVVETKEENTVIEPVPVQNIEQDIPNIEPIDVPPENNDDYDEGDYVNDLPNINYENLAQQIQQNPQDFLNFMMQHPIVGQAVQGNEEEFLEMIQSPEFLENIANPDIMNEHLQNHGAMPGNAGLLGMAQVELSVEDQENIREIIEFTGAPFNVVVQYYVIMDRNKEATTNMILGD